MLVAEISLPVAFSIVGSSPSNPPCNGTLNYLCRICELVKEINVEPFAKEAPNEDASACPKKSPNDIVTLLPLPPPVGIGAKYSLLSSCPKSNPYALPESNSFLASY